jgi:ABC-type lipoprotein export system ATPase subunit
MNEPRGSIWRKWDLHIHTPASALNNQFEGTNDEEKWNNYLEALRSIQGISVLGLTDYFSIEGYKRVLEYLSENQGYLNNIDLILPNVEVRILPVTDERSAINLHIIFSPDREVINNIESQFFSNLEFPYQRTTYKCTRSDLIRLGRAYLNDNEEESAAYKVGVEQFKTDLSSLKKIFDKNEKLRKNCLVVVSNSGSDGASGLQHSSLAATRHEIYRFADAIFSGNPTDREYFLGQGADDEAEVKRRYGSLKPCIHGSDAHRLDRICVPDLDRFTWIKADATFEGLKQIIYEPEARVRIQQAHPDKDHKKPVFFNVHIDDGRIFQKNRPQFASTEIALNRGLVAIIGGRGTGKSLLLDAIKKTFDKSPALDKDSPRFTKIDSSLDVTVHYSKEDGPPNRYRLPDDNNLDYLHVQQGEVKSIVEEPQRLDEEVKKLIGIGKLTTESTIEDRVIQSTIQTIINEQEWLEDTDSAGNKIYDASFQKQQRKKYEDLIATITTKENSELIVQYRRNSILLDYFNTRDSELDALIEELKSHEYTFNMRIEGINSLPIVDVPANDIQVLVEKNADILSLVERHVHAGTVDVLLIEKELPDTVYKELRVALGADYNEDIEDAFWKSKYLNKRVTPVDYERQRSEALAIKAEMASHRKTIEDKNNVIKKKFIDQKITEDVSTLLRKVEQYQSSIDDINETIKIIESRRKSLADSWSALIGVARKLRVHWDQSKNKIEQKWQELKQCENYESSPQRDLIQKLLDGIEITGYVRFDESLFYESVQNWVDMKKFRSREGLSSAERMKNAFGVEDVTTFLQLISNEEVIDLDEVSKLRLSEFLLRDEYFVSGGEIKLLNILFLKENLADYIQVLSKSSYQGKEPTELSVGQRGTFYVCLKLATDTFVSPFVFDQPEDDLDNDFIMKKLVPIFTEIKKYRQVIIVTHNANLCVNADAEQVILAANDAEVISYTSGALENPKIRECVYNILEGGKAAFLKREQKYAFAGTTR